MKRKTIVKILIDITMLVLYLLLMFASGLGGIFHEVVGIGIGILFGVHIYLNRNMLKGLMKNVENESTNIAKSVSLIFDILLMIAMPIVIITGILIGQEIFTFNINSLWDTVYNVHNFASYVCLFVMALHLVLHTKYLVGVFKKIPQSINSTEVKSAIKRFTAGAAAAASVYTVIYFALHNSSILNDSVIENATNENTSSTTEIYDYTIIPDEDEMIIADADDIISSKEEADAPESNTQDNTQNITAEVEAVPTLEEYLSKLNCTACHRGCSLANPHCGKSSNQIERATESYYNEYSVS